jgi:hypothetical protein
VDRRHLVRGNLSYAGFFANGRQEAQQKNNNRRLIAYAAGCTKPYEEVSACAHTRAACTAWGFKDAVRLLALYLLHCKNSFIVKQSRKEMGFTRAELVTSNLFADSVVTTKAVKLLNSTQSIFFSKKKKTNQPIAAEQLHCRSYLRQRLKTRLQAGLRRIDISETVYGSLPRLVRTAKNRKSTTGF